jgi:GTP-binding protein YchF
MQIGIVGLPNVGKSTLFNALTKQYAADAANFPFCTIEPNVGIVNVNDPRLQVLAQVSNTQKIVPAAIQFVDIAGLVKGASQGEGLGNKFLAHIREVDAIVQVVRHFQDSDVVHVEWTTDPMRDVEIINTELIMADLQLIERKIPELERKLKGQDKESAQLLPILQHIQQLLLAGKLAYDCAGDLSIDEKKQLRQFNFLTFKPFIYAINVHEQELKNAPHIQSQFEALLHKPVAIVCAKFESELLEASTEERSLFLQELAEDIATIPTLDDLIALAFRTVWLMYYFTTWEKETRARTIKQGSTAPQAAGVIHTDFERGFIKAEIVSYPEFVADGGRTWARDKGHLRLEGKEYIVREGDVIVFKCNK